MFVGGSFIAENEKDSNLYLTDYQILKRNIDTLHRARVETMKYFNNIDIDMNEEYIGRWSEDIDKNANIYYLVSENHIYKTFFYKPEGLVLNPINVAYAIKQDDKIIACTPEENDVLFDTYEEAFDYVTTQNPLILLS